MRRWRILAPPSRSATDTRCMDVVAVLIALAAFASLFALIRLLERH
jgi:hypothetical protein